MKYLTGDVYFTMDNKDPVSAAMSKVMGFPFSHSGLILGNLNGKTIVCETSSFEVVYSTFDKYEEDPTYTYEVWRHPDHFHVINGQESQIQENTTIVLGIVYGYLQLISLAVRRIISMKLPNFIRQGLVCCHVIGYALHNIKGSGFENLDPESFDTRELRTKLIDEGWILVSHRNK